MSNTFSAVLLGDLNDFIGPGQACINPIFVESDTKVVDPASSTTTKKKATIELTFDDIPNVTATKSLIKLDKSTKAAKVSLSDCLACSGCVTSAETVLLRQQSVQEFLSTMKQIREGTHPSFKVAAVTLSPQVRASFAVRFSLSPFEAHSKIKDFFRNHCGVGFVLDGGALPSDVSQLEVAREFVSRFRQSKKLLPLLTSSCPGWVCYAEKTHAHALPFMCEVKSPQQVSGSIVKRSLQATQGLAPHQVYHCTVMQCPDKKLEGSRKEFHMSPDNEHSAEVNCVLTATELCDAMIEVYEEEEQSRSTTFVDLDAIVHHWLTGEFQQDNELERNFGSCVTGEEANAGGSGSLCAFVFRYAARELFGVAIPFSSKLPFKPGRNPDTWSLDLEMDGKTVLRFAASYGFRNIQDVVRRVKNQTSNAHFVEVMACPGGCTNGGGLLLPRQIEGSKDSTSVANKKILAEQVARTMEQIPNRLVEENPTAFQVIADNPLLLRTTFNAVKDMFQPDGMTQTW